MKAWFKAFLQEVSGRLQRQREVLRLFLSDADPRYVDVDDKIVDGVMLGEGVKFEEKRQRALFDEKKQLGLPYYAICSGGYIGNHFGDENFAERDLAEEI